MNFLASSSAGYLTAEDFEKLILLFEKEASRWSIAKSTEANLIRILSSLFDRTSFLIDCINYPHYFETLVGLAVNSNYLTDIIVRNPEYLYWILNSSHLKKTFTHLSFTQEINKTIQSYKSFNGKVNSLRLLKRREILRIGVKDILKEADLSEIVSELSVLAKGISSVLFQLCYEEICRQYNIENFKGEYALIALGKLGGNELNYSSDIDLILFYDSNQIINGIEYYEVLTKTIHLFIESASVKTENGFLYRIDFRLRPDGRTSPLCRTLNDYLRYYEIRGEDWERQMLIKMSFVCGSESLYKTFYSYIQPFIYPASFTISPLEQIRRLKKNIEKKIGEEENIKLQPGGIRDIEFSVQALQLLNGGRIEEIKSANTLNAISMLARYNLLSSKEKEIFLEAYIFYRKIEHYLQLMNDTQTHIIPEKGEVFDRLIIFLGYTHSSFRNILIQLKKNVSEIFNLIVDPTYIDKKNDISISLISFKDKTRSLKNIEYLRTGTGLLEQKQFDKKSIEAFAKIEESLEKYLMNSLQPDKVLQNFVRVIKGSHFPSIWYDEFADTSYFHLFLTLCEYSQLAIDLFAEDKTLRDLLLSKKALQNINTDSLSHFKPKEIFFILAVQLTAKIITSREVAKILSLYLHQYISFLIESYKNKSINKYDYFIVGLGSFGCEEMSFTSDVDIIIVGKDIIKQTNTQNDFVGLLNYLKNSLQPVSIDSRLRPEGKSAYLVWDIKSCKTYIEKRADIWELQSYSKLRFIYGNEKLFQQFINFTVNRVSTEKEHGIKKYMSDMRKRLYPAGSVYLDQFNIKKNKGGILDIDFVFQYLVMINPQLYNSSIGKNKEEIIDSLMKNKDTKNDIKTLFENFNFFKQIELWNQNLFHSSGDLLPDDVEKRNLISDVTGYKDVTIFNEIFKQKIKENSSLYDKYLGERK